ncbi:limb region 1 protein homolog isoform X2 [Trachemys scripta elegans]|uniref:limb region 1 protein homolog isoform X2 n=1 Tax=Trachemys scripta elegans TaxID=31138 RepID=UPI00155274EA|nr:limb region 1 protein homolog isoform X2 [Trachemys scripta elegans]
MEADEVTIREQNFHSQVREYTICFLLFAVLYIVSYFVITRYKRKADEQEDEDAIVNRISTEDANGESGNILIVILGDPAYPLLP